MKTCFGLLFVAVACLLMVQGCVKSPPPVPPDVVIASGTFDDGFVVELLRAELAPQMAFGRNVRGAWLWSSGSTRTYGSVIAGIGYELNQKVSDGQLAEVSMKLYDDEEPVFYALLRARRPDGSCMLNEAICVHGSEHQIERKEGAFWSFIDRGTGSDDPAKMELHVQVEDGAGGWRDLIGPVMFTAEDGRAFVVGDAIPRRQPTLRLRALHAGRPPVEFSVPNPGYKPSFASLKPQTVPAIHDGGEFKVRCDGLKWVSGFGLPPLLEANLHLDAPALRMDCLRLQNRLLDETGNHYLRRGVKTRGFDPLPGEQVLLVRSLVEREKSIYPWREEEVTFIAEGTLADSSAQQKVELTEAGRQLGCTSVTFQPPDPAGKSSWLAKPYVLDFEVKGACTGEQLTANQKTHDRANLVVFSEAKRSIGESESHSSGTSSGTGIGAGIGATFHMQARWAGDLKPGERFRLGWLKKHEPEVVGFVLQTPEKPAITGK
jgi:hypothetical protein